MTPTAPLEFFVPGTPQPGGSKRAFVNKKTGRAAIVDDAKGNKPWRDRVASFARDAYSGPLLDGPLSVRFEFTVARPKGHYGTGRNARAVRSSAPAFPAVKPDALKLARSTEDALTGILWRDDALTVDLRVTKTYGDHPGVLVRVEAKHRPGDELPADIEPAPDWPPQVWRSATVEVLSA